MAKKSKDKILVSEDEVFDVIEFAQKLGYPANALTPMLVSSRMKDVTLNPMQATESELSRALQNPKESEIQLQSFSQDFELKSQVYKKLLAYLGNMLSFDWSYECVNAKGKDYPTKAYEKDLDIVKRFMDGFDHKHSFNIIVNELLRNETYFGCPWFGKDKMVLQELPSSPTYTMINGQSDWGFEFAFNMYWFIQPGVDIEMYPRFFRQKFRELMASPDRMQTYIPSLSPMGRGSSSYVYWQDVPIDVGWCFKFNPYISTRLPYFTGLFSDLLQQPLMRELQKNINMSTASRMLIGEVGMLKDAKMGVKDQFNMSADSLAKFLALVKSAVGESIKVAAAPLNNLQSVSFDSDSDMYSTYLKTALASSGANTNLLFTSETRPNSIESQLSLNVDEQMMTSLYPQFESFLEYWINKNTKKFKFKIHLEGTQFYNDKEMRREAQTMLMDKGIVLPGKIAAAYQMSPFEMIRMMEESKATGFVDDLLTPIVSGFQMSGDDTGSASGRPKKSTRDLGEAGEQTRAVGGNIGKGGK